jgi:hypothetical protein
MEGQLDPDLVQPLQPALATAHHPDARVAVLLLGPIAILTPR